MLNPKVLEKKKELEVNELANLSHEEQLKICIELVNNQIDYNLERYNALLQKYPQKKSYKDNIQMEIVVKNLINNGAFDTWEDRYTLLQLHRVENSDRIARTPVYEVGNIGKQNYEFIKNLLEMYGTLIEDDTVSRVTLEIDLEKIKLMIAAQRVAKEDKEHPLWQENLEKNAKQRCV